MPLAGAGGSPNVRWEKIRFRGGRGLADRTKGHGLDFPIECLCLYVGKIPTSRMPAFVAMFGGGRATQEQVP